MPPAWSDSHAHLTDERFADDLDAVIDRARAAGLARLVTVASRLGDGEACADLAGRHDFVTFAVGLHPHEAKHWSLETVRGIERTARRNKCIAIGEIGLDYHYNLSPPKEQRAAFREQIVLARGLGLPIVLHTRSAWDDTFAILRDENAASLGGAFHCFSGGPEEAHKALATGFLLSFAGPLTFKNADALREAAAMVPADRLLIETDAPYLTPHPHRGERNEPARVGLVGERLAAIHDVAPDALAATVTANLERLFRIAEARSAT
ncbi:MAG TPA: TatD family hydrolase [Candidatus Polarisedimenticolia bacterium]|nr:TatD family hydrolase [Candidatus Polarisedimenticolia bacterium]